MLTKEQHAQYLRVVNTTGLCTDENKCSQCVFSIRVGTCCRSKRIAIPVVKEEMLRGSSLEAIQKKIREVVERKK